MKLRQFHDAFKSRFLTPYTLQHTYGALLAKNKPLKDSQQGKRCFIMGTGPSINQQDLLKIKNEHLFVVSTFWKHPDFRALRPRYYCTFDTENFPNVSGRGAAFVQDLIDRDTVISSVPETKLFFHSAGKPFIESQKLYTHNEKYYLHFHRFFKENLSFNIEIDRVLPNVRNVIVGCIILAAYMGYEEIYLLGCEHSFLAQPSYQHYEKFKMFHEMKVDINNPDDVKRYALAIMPYEKHIDSVKILFKNYRLLKEKLAREKPCVRIYNATPDSFLDVFPFVQYDNVVRAL